MPSWALDPADPLAETAMPPETAQPPDPAGWTAFDDPGFINPRLRRIPGLPGAQIEIDVALRDPRPGTQTVRINTRPFPFTLDLAGAPTVCTGIALAAVRPRVMFGEDAAIGWSFMPEGCTPPSPPAGQPAIVDFGARARDNKIKLEDLQGGTFSITNGGVFGSLMSTPILNSPQSGILGMHKIQPRPMAIGDKIEIRPMMYLALSYDHRIVDGREAVTFLVKVKENLEDPQRMILEI